MLAGRVKAEGPFGWHAENPDLVSRIEEGMHLHRWFAASSYDGVAMRNKAEALAEFLRAGLTLPPREERAPTVQEARGQTLFTSPETRCVTCHDAANDYSDRMPHIFRPWPSRKGFSVDLEETGFKTPSLRFVVGTAPYYHDGSAATLEELIDKNNDRMGLTKQLSKADRGALVAFLRTL
jgi:cytochrome c peroxidase